MSGQGRRRERHLMEHGRVAPADVQEAEQTTRP